MSVLVQSQASTLELPDARLSVDAQAAHEKRPRQRWIQLDSLRVFAMLAIFSHHFANVRLGMFGTFLGLFGVQIFLALSGFLITSVLVRDRGMIESTGQSWQSALGQFYVRRSLRVFPLYYLVLILGYALDASDIRQSFGWFATYTSNFYIAFLGNWDDPGRFAHLWTLAVQEQYYLFWAPFILTANRRWWIPATLAMIAFGPIYRLIGVLVSMNEIAIRVVTFSCFDALGLGSLLALLLHTDMWKRWQVQFRWFLLVSGVGMVTLLVMNYAEIPKVNVVADKFFLSFIAIWLISGAVAGFGGRVGRILNSKPLLFAGKISYGMYIYHLFAPNILARCAAWLGIGFSAGGIKSLFFSTMLTLAIASLSWFCFESPINNFKSRFRPAGAG